MARLLRINAADNVAVALGPVAAGETVRAGGGGSGPAAVAVTARQNIPPGHKIALADIPAGAEVIKYGFPIGRTTRPVRAGEWVHTHNLATGLGEILTYSYNPRPVPASPRPDTINRTFQGYRRPDGRVGTRNEIWIIPTVSCVNRTAQLLAEAASRRLAGSGSVDGVYAFPHPWGCSQMGEDQLNTQQILAGLVNHPNAGAVLVLGLGCENNNVAAFQKVLGSWDEDRVKFLVAQEVDDELAAGEALIEQLAAYASRFRREECPAAALVAGLKCGGSDGFSGITANPLVGAFSDRLIACGGASVLTEVPEMFGAETILMDRAADAAVFDKIVRLINDFKAYYTAHGQVIYDNPSPGNKAGGISTLEEKSLGCTQKGGTGTVTDVVPYGGQVRAKGLSLLSGPGNDLIAVTALAAAGCQIILFTTGRGTPLGTAAPTIKIATNSRLAAAKAAWIDFDAGRLLAGETLDSLAEELFSYVLEVASGRRTKSEEMGFRDIGLFKNGVIL